MAVPLISQLYTLLGNQQFPSQLASILSKHNANESYASNDHLVLRIEASIWTKDASRSLPGTILLVIVLVYEACILYSHIHRAVLI